MGEIVSIANQKGGVGKTTTSINLGAALACLNQQVLVIDFDPQSNVTSGLGIPITQEDKTIYDVIIGNASVETTIKQTNMEWLDCIPAKRSLAGAEIELVSVLSRETVLSKALDSIRQMYDFIIIDCPPSLGLLTINALAASDTVITPVQCEYYAMEGLAYFMETIKKVKEAINPDLRIDGGVVTMYDARINLANQVKGEISKHYGEKLYKTTIPRNVRLAEAPGIGQPIFIYDPSCRGARAYCDLGIEFLGRRGADAETFKNFQLCETNDLQADYDFGG